MSSFEIIGKHPTSKKTNKAEIINLVKKSLLKNYDEKTIQTNGNGLTVTGFTKGFFEHAYTNAKIEIIINENEIVYRGNGTVTPGKFPWFKILLGLIPSLQIFLVWAVSNWIEFIISKEKPRQYFKDALKSIEWLNYSQESNNLQQSSVVVQDDQEVVKEIDEKTENKSSNLKNILAGSDIEKKPSFYLDFETELLPVLEKHIKEEKVDIEISPNINKLSLHSATTICYFPDYDRVAALLVSSSKKDAFIFGIYGIYYYDDLGDDQFSGRIFYEEFFNRTFNKKGWFDIDLDKGKSISAASFSNRNAIISLLNDIQMLCQYKLGKKINY